MIVKDRKKTMEKCYEISNKLLDLIQKEALSFYTDDNDPAEHIYLFMHVLARVNFLILITLEGYGGTYGIEKLTTNDTRKIVNFMIDEYLKIYEENNNDIE